MLVKGGPGGETSWYVQRMQVLKMQYITRIIHMLHFVVFCCGLVPVNVRIILLLIIYPQQNRHCDDVIMGAIASVIASITIVYSTVSSDADQKEHQSTASLAFVWGIHRGPINSPHKWPVTQKISISWRYNEHIKPRIYINVDFETISGPSTHAVRKVLCVNIVSICNVWELTGIVTSLLTLM